MLRFDHLNAQNKYIAKMHFFFCIEKKILFDNYNIILKNWYFVKKKHIHSYTSTHTANIDTTKHSNWASVKFGFD